MGVQPLQEIKKLYSLYHKKCLAERTSIQKNKGEEKFRDILFNMLWKNIIFKEIYVLKFHINSAVF